uniref:FT-interacting protein 1-like n=1 Tax=Tanacetum cinerariifolium TaxID=118510 RepID=A0A699IH56_TANCI|nr:FT-interacting protein 1-like [Tanacetum cinerariifolium]
MTISGEEGDERAPGLQALIVAEPLILSIEDRVVPNKDDVLGRCMLSLQYVDQRLDHKAINTRRFNLEKHVMVVEGEKKKEVKFVLSSKDLDWC